MVAKAPIISTTYIFIPLVTTLGMIYGTLNYKHTIEGSQFKYPCPDVEELEYTLLDVYIPAEDGDEYLEIRDIWRGGRTGNNMIAFFFSSIKKMYQGV